jgi:hypothetical protein
MEGCVFALAATVPTAPKVIPLRERIPGQHHNGTRAAYGEDESPDEA